MFLLGWTVLLQLHCLCARLCCICAFCASSCAVLNCVFIGHCLCARVSGVFVLLCVVVCCRFLRALPLLFLSLLSSSSVGDAPAHKHHQPLHISVDVEFFLEALHFSGAIFLKIPRDPSSKIYCDAESSLWRAAAPENNSSWIQPRQAEGRF